ncbi:MAG TPA: nuclear transport factor 2 family protein [Chloroflexota bacterium]|nr:nuclear transport factor 2 family protein [Chloroflexota bacterium]
MSPEPASTALDPATAGARRWLSALQTCVRAVDFENARPLFAEDVVSFGTHASVVAGRDALERDQWRHVWPRIRDFSFRLDDTRCLGDDRGLVVVVPWDSLGVRPDGTTFPRPGRATVLLRLRERQWVAAHTHFSLSPPA